MFGGLSGSGDDMTIIFFSDQWYDNLKFDMPLENKIYLKNE